MPVQETLNGEAGTEVTAQMGFGVAFHEISHSHRPGRAAGLAALGGARVNALLGGLPCRQGAFTCLGEAGCGVVTLGHTLRRADLAGHSPGSWFASARHPVCEGPGHGTTDPDPQGQAMAVGQIDAHTGGAHRAELGVSEGHGTVV